MAHNLFHANYGDYKKSSPDTAVLLLLSKVTQKHFRQPYRPSKVPLRPAGGITSGGRLLYTSRSGS